MILYPLRLSEKIEFYISGSEMEEEKFSTVIVPKSGWFDIDVSEIWRYRDLIFLFVKRNFVILFKQTILGPAWAVIQPLLTTIVFTVVFGKLAGLSAKGVPSFLFYLSGTVAWQYFSSALTQTSDTFVENAAILGKVYFPRIVMPISTVITNLINFFIQFGIFSVLIVVYALMGKIHPNIYVLMLPILILHMAMLGLGTGIIISAATTKYRDLRLLVSFGVQLWMYATPVAYDINIIPDRLRDIYMLNPMTPVINAFRTAFLGIGSFDLKSYLISWIVTAVILFIGIILFSRVEKTFVDTV